MFFIVMTLDVLNWLKSKLFKDSHPLNKYAIETILLALKLEKFIDVNFLQFLNINTIVVA